MSAKHAQIDYSRIDPTLHENRYNLVVGKAPTPNFTLRMEIRRRYLAGESIRQIAIAVGRSSQRVLQIITSLGINKDGGLYARKRNGSLKKDLKLKGIEDRCREKFGITREMRAQIIERFGIEPFARFSCQKHSAKERGISFEMNFREWWETWTASGKWEKRGRHKGEYVMCRHGDAGPYAVGNVAIKTCSENIIEVRNRERMQRHGGGALEGGRPRDGSR